MAEGLFAALVGLLVTGIGFLADREPAIFVTAFPWLMTAIVFVFATTTACLLGASSGAPPAASIPAWYLWILGGVFGLTVYIGGLVHLSLHLVYRRRSKADDKPEA